MQRLHIGAGLFAQLLLHFLHVSHHAHQFRLLSAEGRLLLGKGGLLLFQCDGGFGLGFDPLIFHGGKLLLFALQLFLLAIDVFFQAVQMPA